MAQEDLTNSASNQNEEKFDVGNCLKRGAFSGTIMANSFGQPTLEKSLTIAGAFAVGDVIGTGIVYLARKGVRKIAKSLSKPG